MTDDRSQLRGRLRCLCRDWQRNGLPSRMELEQQADELARWRTARNLPGLWPVPPVMVTATIDDGMGYGLEVIHWYARTAGIALVPLGLLQTADTIVAACRRRSADLLGLTVLQFNSEEMVRDICAGLPARTRVVAGGPVFRAGVDFAGLTGIHFAARDVGAFLGYLLEFAPGP